MKKLLGFLFVLLSVSVALACTETTTATTVVTTPHQIDYETEVTLNVAINYAGKQYMAITYQNDAAYVSTVDGKTYSKGDLLPVWAAIGDKLNINFVDVALSSDESTNAQFTRLQGTGFAGVDLVNGTGALIGPEGVAGNFVDLGDYLDSMPNLKAFLTANPDVKVSLTSADGGIYFTPYFDGLGEMEQMYLARIDWIEDILDVVSPTFDTTLATLPSNYTNQQMPDALTTNIIVAKADGTTRTVEKSYTQNILDIIKALPGTATGADIANAFRAYMTATYGDQGYAKLSQVFTGVDAAYDTDELVALMYVVKSNPQYLTREHTDGADTAVEVIFPREKKGSRIRNLLRGMEMFGLRGVFSRCEWLYFDEDNMLQDIRHDQSFVDGVNNLADLYNDKLIVQNPESHDPSDLRNTYLKKSLGFMMYDYNATQTASALVTAATLIDPTYKFEAILPPVVDWLENGTYFHFTEAVRSVKNEAWGIPVDANRSETELYRILKVVDEMYDYSSADSVGTIHLYGPSSWTNGTLDYGTDTVYKFSDTALAEMAGIGLGSMIDYLRIYVGATMPIGHVRSMGLEYQTLSAQGIEGIEKINTAVEAGVMLLAGQVDSTEKVGVDETNPWFQLCPTFFPLTQSESTLITASASFRSIYTDNTYITLVKNGFSGNGGSLTEAAYWATFKMNTVDVYDLIYIKAYRDAYARIGE
jgi:putative aldouronate transport system substrate-binding protein